MPTPPTPADRFAHLIEGLCRAVAARGGRGGLAGPLIILIWTRLRRMAARFTRLAARVRAGKAAPCRPVSPRPASERSRPPYQRLPRGVAWLIRLVPEAASAASQLQHLLADPEVAALIAAAPQAGRILRPLCRMLGVRPPPGLLTPPATPASVPGRAATPGRAPPPIAPPRPRAPAPAPAALVRACGPPAPA